MVRDVNLKRKITDTLVHCITFILVLINSYGDCLGLISKPRQLDRNKAVGSQRGCQKRLRILQQLIRCLKEMNRLRRSFSQTHLELHWLALTLSTIAFLILLPCSPFKFRQRLRLFLRNTSSSSRPQLPLDL